MSSTIKTAFLATVGVLAALLIVGIIMGVFNK